MAFVFKGANTTAQWYEDNFSGESVYSFLEKFLLHTTETEGWPGYSGGASAPNATYHPRLREIRQHFPNNYSARALRDPSDTTVRENRDRVCQLEIVAYSDKALARSVGGLWIGDLTDSHFTDLAWMAIQLNQDLGLPLQTSVTWKEGTGSYYGGVRLSGSSYDAYRGILGHVHASGNTHWDPGGLYVSRLMAKIKQLQGAIPSPPPPEDDMSVADARIAMAQMFDEAANRSTATGRNLDDDLKNIIGETIKPMALRIEELFAGLATTTPTLSPEQIQQIIDGVAAKVVVPPSEVDLDITVNGTPV
jgi:hypothetical protein